MRRKMWLGSALLIVVVGGWAAFRPERILVNQTVNESFPVGGATETTAAAADATPMLVASGSFHDGAHPTSGTATLYQLRDNKRVLRLTNFATSNGPDVQLYLVKAADATDNDMVKQAGFVNLGLLKGNVGDQNYDVPSDVDLSAYRAVTVWCRRFGVNFGTAPLVLADAGAMLGEPEVLTSGSFHSVAHETRGIATVFALADGKRLLRLTDFATSNGPDVQLYLVKAADATDNDTVKNAGFVPLGALKGNVGDQNYELPADVDLSQYRSVTVWCRRFGVNFGTAPLAPTHS